MPLVVIFSFLTVKLGAAFASVVIASSFVTVCSPSPSLRLYVYVSLTIYSLSERRFSKRRTSIDSASIASSPCTSSILVTAPTLSISLSVTVKPMLVCVLVGVCTEISGSAFASVVIVSSFVTVCSPSPSLRS